MENETFLTLLEERKEDIIATIEMVTEESFLPDFYGTYEICLDGTDGQIYVFMAERDTLFYLKNPSLYYLHTVKSHAIKEGDFKDWLSHKGISVPDGQTEKELKRIYRQEYKKFLAAIREEALWEIVHVDTVFTEIKGMYGGMAKEALTRI